MRFTYVGDFVQSYSTEGYICDALNSLGYDVDRLQEDKWDDVGLRKHIIGRADDRKHILLFTKWNVGINDSMVETFNRLRDDGATDLIVGWYFDLFRPEFLSCRFNYVSRAAAASDLFLSTDGGAAEVLNLSNVATLRQGYAGPTNKIGMGSVIPKLSRRVAHLGSIYRDRGPWFRLLNRELRMAAISNIRGNDLFNLCKSVKVIVGPPYPYYPDYWSNRIYVICGHGGLFACPTVRGMAEEGWTPGVNYIALSPEPEKAIAELRHAWLPMSDENLQEIRDAGQKLVWEKFTYVHRVQELIKRIQVRL